MMKSKLDFNVYHSTPNPEKILGPPSNLRRRVVSPPAIVAEKVETATFVSSVQCVDKGGRQGDSSEDLPIQISCSSSEPSRLSSATPEELCRSASEWLNSKPISIGAPRCDTQDGDAITETPQSLPAESLIQEALRWEEQCLMLQKRLERAEAGKAALQQMLSNQLRELEVLRKEFAQRYGNKVSVPKAYLFELAACGDPDPFPEFCLERL
eukprot:gnl/MRDRNA2_/MRDRNA2_56077_c0_seq1.p1 gnl/MRDRNA2_/MRDRNA2_56077_c0~~gnl/MRDRNA2_/MRDRNA2_56077_c0_seq1.p1  ORF type:complete len:211 (+),score=48.15 gnl/MRDRNA2_/MRDRNA2_56077_c0_seq1:57-689(+)